MKISESLWNMCILRLLANNSGRHLSSGGGSGGGGYNTKQLYGLEIVK